MSRTEGHSKIGSTEYKTVFLTHGNAKPPESFKPALKALTHDVPMTADTTHRLDYVKHLVTPLIPHPPTLYKKPEGSMAGESEYTKEYRSKTPEPPKPVLPAISHMRSNSQPFQGQSTQARDFIAYTIPPREFYGERRVYAPPTEPFAKTTTIQSDFTGKQPTELTKSTKPPQIPKISRDPFDGNTCHRNDYRMFALPERFQRQKIVYQPPQEAFKGVTTFTSDFPGHRGIKPLASLKPPVVAKNSDARFDSRTTTRQSYRQWELPPRFSRPPTVYEPPKEKFETITSFSKDFIHHGMPEPAFNYKPKSQPIQYERPMEQDTVHRLDFQAWDVTNRQQPCRQERPYEPPVEKFDGQSTTSSVYRGAFAPPASSTKPLLRPYSKGEKFDGVTTYRDCYSTSGLKSSCAITQFSGYEFSHEDARTGHKFYIPKSSSPATPAVPDIAAESVPCNSDNLSE